MSKQLECTATLDVLSTGTAFFRLTSLKANIENESFEFHAQQKIIDFLRLHQDDEVKIIFVVDK